ncbi:MAG: flavin reductase family protein [Pseudomonadota bacterium]
MTDPYRSLKNAFGRYATGVTVISCINGAATPTAITVNSFSSVSLEPPLVMWCIDKKASAFETFYAADHYAVSVLPAGAEDVSNRFASHAPEPISDAESERWISGAPLLADRIAGFDCRVTDRHDAGDHVILVGEVLKFDCADGAPLLYYASAYASGPEAQR